MLAPAGTPVDELESKLTVSPALGAAGEKVNWACKVPPPPPPPPPSPELMLMLWLPWAPEQPVLVANTVFEPVVDQETEMLLPVALPAMVPPFTLQVQPLASAVQLLADALKVTAWFGCPVNGPKTEIDGGGGGG